MAFYVGQAYGQIDNNGNISWERTSTENDPTNGIFAKLTNDNSEDQQIGEISNFAIYYFGIQTLPGVRFNVNSNKTTASSFIQIGQTGIFELNLFDSTPIEEIKFENLYQKLSENAASNGVNYCLIDIIFEKTK